MITGDQTISKLNQFADRCRETTGASFTISKNKVGVWTVSFVNKGQQFTDYDLLLAIEMAEKWLIKSRKEVEVETKYTLYVS